MFGEEEDDLPAAPLWRRIGVPLAGIAGASGLAWLAIGLLRHPSPAPRPHQEPPHIVSIRLPPPPPPPPTPPPPQPQKQEVAHQMPSPVKASVPKPAPRAPSPPAALTTSIQGAGNSGLGFSASGGGGGDCIGAGCGNGEGDGGGDQAAYFAGLIKTQIEAALGRDDKLRFAHYRVTVALLMDLSGHAVRATVRDFNGDSDLQSEINRVLLTIATNEKLPAEIASQPVLLRINAHARG